MHLYPNVAPYLVSINVPRECLQNANYTNAYIEVRCTLIGFYSHNNKPIVNVEINNLGTSLAKYVIWEKMIELIEELADNHFSEISKKENVYG